MKAKINFKLVISIAALLIFTGIAKADLINGEFEHGLNGWTITPTSNGITFIQDTINFDIDGRGPLGVSMAGRFSVGQIDFDAGDFAGIELTQNVGLNTGDMISVDLAVWNNNDAFNAEGGRFELIVNGSVLATFNTGHIDTGQQIFGSLAAKYSGPDGTFNVGLRITRPFTVPGGLVQFVDNFVIPTPGILTLLGLAGIFSKRHRRRLAN